MDHESEKKLKDRVLETIKNGKIKMRPRWQFILRAALIATGGIILLLTILYLVSFIIFTSRETGAWFVPAFGIGGWYAFLVSLPWLLIILSLIFITVLELLVRHYAFAYRRPLLYSMLAIVFLVIVSGFVVAQTSFHGNISRYADDNRASLIGRLYHEFNERRFNNIHRGEITDFNKDGFFMKNRRKELLRILVNAQTRLYSGAELMRGDRVVIFGDRHADIVHALGIRRLTK